jgi:hypothetical protein
MVLEDRAMESAMHVKTKVLPGKKIEVTSSSLVEGEQVEVFIVFPDAGRGRRRRVLDIIESTAPPQVFKTADDADRHVEDERSSWDR